MTFADHFSGHADVYARFRPTYPDTLFDWLATQVPRDAVVWDCATGNGQAATSLAARFSEVFATDASAQQIAAADARPNIHYGVAGAEDSGLPAQSVDLVTVAQALHWFDHTAFATEVQRVLRPGGLVVAWCYELYSITPEIDAPMLHLCHDIVGADWPPERRYIETGYADIPWPWPKIATPTFSMAAQWSVEQTLGYLRSWSASKRWQAREGSDPVALIETDLRRAWGPDETRLATWPLRMLVSRV